VDAIADGIREKNPDIRAAMRDELWMEFQQLQRMRMPHLSGEQAAELSDVWLLRDLSRLNIAMLIRTHPIHKDRLDPIDPSAKLELNAEKLNAFVLDIANLAYAQGEIGYRVERDMPGLKEPEVEELYVRAASLAEGQHRQGYGAAQSEQRWRRALKTNSQLHVMMRNMA